VTSYKHEVFDSQLDGEWRLARRLGNPLGYLLLEFDDVSDDDIAVEDFSRVLKRELRPTDLIGWLGYGQFAVMCPSASSQQLDALRSHLEHALRADPRAPGKFDIGVAMMGERDAIPEDMVARARDDLFTHQRSVGSTTRN
jgi:GGDEF domain-containing protein